MAGVLVLDRNWRAVDFISAERAVTLCLLGKATAVLEYEDKVFRSEHLTINVPRVISLKVYVPLSEKATSTVTRRILAARDNHTCQYCGTHRDHLPKGVIMTKDHVIPVSRFSGATRSERYKLADTWENVVLACGTCNHRKDRHTPEEVGMKLLSQPRRPTEVTFVIFEKADEEQLKYAKGEF